MTITSELMTTKSEDDVWKRLHATFVPFGQFKAALAEIEEFLEYSEGSDDERGMLLTGVSGAGKSTVIRTFVSRYPGVERPEGVARPVFAASITSPATVKGVAMDLLQGLGADRPETGATQWRTERLATLFDDCGVRLVFLDEFHHLTQCTTDKNMNNVANWIKALLNRSHISLVLAGTPETLQVLKSNSQLSSRFVHRVELKPFSWKQDEDEFRRFLKSLERAFSQYGPAVDLTSKDLPERLFLTSGGLLRPLMQLIRHSVRYAIKTQLSECGEACLAKRLRRMKLDSYSVDPFELSASQVNAAMRSTR